MNDWPDPGTYLLRLFLVAAFGAICFGAGTLYERRKTIPVCVEQPRKQVSYPKTKKEMAAWIQRYSNGGM